MLDIKSHMADVNDNRLLEDSVVMKRYSRANGIIHGLVKRGKV